MMPCTLSIVACRPSGVALAALSGCDHGIFFPAAAAACGATGAATIGGTSATGGTTISVQDAGAAGAAGGSGAPRIGSLILAAAARASGDPNAMLPCRWGAPGPPAGPPGQ